MPRRSTQRCIAMFSACGLSTVAWGGQAAAQEPPAAQPPAPAPVQETKREDPDKDKLAQNSVFAEGLGAGILYSLNYERMVVDQLGVRIGFAYLSLGASASANGTSSSASASYVFIPVTASYVGIRSGKSALELGGGVTFLYLSGAANAGGVSASGAGVLPFGVAMVGYRLQPVGHAGFMFRIGADVLVAPGIGLQNPNPNTLGFIPSPYISLGASF